ncbi:MAG: ADP-ribosylglycohydrolase family protein [Mycobacterium sp.]
MSASASPAAACDRAHGVLVGLAVGDAMGMPTQYLPREVVRARYGVLTGFEPGPPDNEISAGLPAGRVTDDTDQAVIVGRLLVEGGGRVDPQLLAERLLAWQERMAASGSLDLLGPSTLKALERFETGSATNRSGRWGDTNGAAMRIAPVGIATPAADLGRLVDAVEAVSFVTHNTGIAIAGAAAIAAAVSSGIDGNTLAASLDRAVGAAEMGAHRGFYVAGADVAARIRWALNLVAGTAPEDAADTVSTLIGTGVATQEAIPAALAMASMFPGDPWEVCRRAASLGGDCDTIAAMAGAVVAAHVGASAFPAEVIAELMAANPDLDLDSLTKDLVRLRLTATGAEVPG